MLEYAEKLTLSPAMMTEDDINALRATGWDDRDVLDIVMACAYFNFRVRVVDGLGLQVSDNTAVNAIKAREHAASLAADKGVSSPPTSGASGSRRKQPARAASPPQSLPPRKGAPSQRDALAGGRLEPAPAKAGDGGAHHASFLLPPRHSCAPYASFLRRQESRGAGRRGGRPEALDWGGGGISFRRLNTTAVARHGEEDRQCARCHWSGWAVSP